MTYITQILQAAASEAGLKYKQGHLDEIVAILDSESAVNMDIDSTLIVFTDITQKGIPPQKTAIVQMLIIKSANKSWISAEREEYSFYPLREFEEKLLKNIRKFAIIKKDDFSDTFRERVENAFNFGQRGYQVFNENLDGLEINCSIAYNELNEKCLLLEKKIKTTI